MTTTTANPVPLLLPGQAASPEGPTDLSAMYVMHHAFRRDLRAFAAAVAAAPAADRPRWRALHERFELFSFILHEHHTGEDAALWPLLLERVDAARDAAARATLAAMEAEHADIDPVLAACRAGFARLAGHADEDARAALEVRVVAVRQLLERHLEHEERDAMALFQKYATPADWHRLDEETFRAAYGFRDTLRAVPWVMHELPDAARDRMFGGDPAGRVFVRLWKLLLRRPFERRERRAFG